jgi:hypothetical protein
MSLGIHSFSCPFLFIVHGMYFCNFHNFLNNSRSYFDVYHAIKILVIPIIVIIVSKFGSLIIQLDIHIVIKMNENSLIGISAIPVRKLFLLICHIIFKSHMINAGLNMTTKIKPTTINHRFKFQSKDRFDHKRTK